jgi:hypothetical protein
MESRSLLLTRGRELASKSDRNRSFLKARSDPGFLAMMKTQTFFFLLVLTTSSCSTEWQIKSYSGDGKITEYRNRFFAQNGYTIRFEPLSFGSDVCRFYRFTHIPKVAWQVQCYLVLEDSRIWVEASQYEWLKLHQTGDSGNYANKDELEGELEVSLKDSKGDVIFEVRQPWSKYVWSRGGNGPWMLYDDKFKMFFKPAPAMQYGLEIKADRASLLNATKGYLLLESGHWSK